jgi:hypothetical protein
LADHVVNQNKVRTEGNTPIMAQFTASDDLSQEQEEGRFLVAVGAMIEHSDYRWLAPREALRLAEHEGVRSDLEAFLSEIARSK